MMLLREILLNRTALRPDPFLRLGTTTTWIVAGCHNAYLSPLKSSFNKPPVMPEVILLNLEHYTLQGPERTDRPDLD